MASDRNVKKVKKKDMTGTSSLTDIIAAVQQLQKLMIFLVSNTVSTNDLAPVLASLQACPALTGATGPITVLPPTPIGYIPTGPTGPIQGGGGAFGH